jgi:transposase InsO family protein
VRDGARQAPDLVDRNFTADRPNMLWVADITYIPTWAGFLYLAVVLDAFSRRIVAWSMATTLQVLDARPKRASPSSNTKPGQVQSLRPGGL